MQQVPSTRSDVMAYEELQQRMLAAVSTGNVDEYAACFDDDAIVMPPGAPVVAGRQAIRDWIRGLFSQFNVSVEETRQELHFTADWAIQRHNYVLTATPKGGGQPMVDRGKAVMISRRMADGSWKSHIGCWNSDRPAAVEA
jgi:uncharacterized protein (TIGR02246 family)